MESYKGISVEDYHNIPRVLLYGEKWKKDAESLSLESFKDATFFCLSEEEEAGSIELVEQCCGIYGFAPKIQVVPNRESILTCVQSGMGVAIADGWSRGLYDPKINYFRLEERFDFMVATAMNDARKNKEAVILANALRYSMSHPENNTDILMR